MVDVVVALVSSVILRCVFQRIVLCYYHLGCDVDTFCFCQYAVRLVVPRRVNRRIDKQGNINRMLLDVPNVRTIFYKDNDRVESVYNVLKVI